MSKMFPTPGRVGHEIAPQLTSVWALTLARMAETRPATGVFL